MVERHGDFSIMASQTEGFEGQYTVVNVVKGQVRHFETIEACREYIGVAGSHGPQWDAVPLDSAGKPLHEPAVIAAANERRQRKSAETGSTLSGSSISRTST